MKKTTLLLAGIFTLALGYRLLGFFNPLLDFHAWRQTGTASIAANFYEQGMNIFKPRLDTFQPADSTTLQGIEFQIYPYLVACGFFIFGLRDWVARAVAIAFGLAVLPYLYLLAKRFLGERVALWSCFFYAVLPMAVYYTRTAQPESSMLFFSVAALYHFDRYVDSEKNRDFALAAGMSLLCFLSKIPTLYMLFPMAFLALRRFGGKTLMQKRWWAFALLTAAPALLWSWKAPQILGSSSLLRAEGKWATAEILLSLEFYRHIFLTRIAEKMFAFTLFPFLLIGLCLRVENSKNYVFHAWFGGIILYILAVAQGNSIHEYYQVPIILPGGIFCALGVEKAFQWSQTRSKNWKFLLWAMIFFVPAHSLFKLHSRLKVDRAPLQLGEILQAASRRDDLIIGQNAGEPEIFYYARRKGWHVEADCTPTEVELRKTQGAKYFATAFKDLKDFNAPLYAHLNRHYRKIYDGPGGVIFKLDEKKEL